MIIKLMDFKMKCNISLLIILIISLSHEGLCTSHDDLEKEISNLKDRVSQLETKLNILTSGLDEVLDNVKDTNSEVKETDSSESITEVSDKCKNHTPQPAITPLEARREVSDDMVTFTVKYQSSVTSINASWHDALGADVQGTTTTMDRGVYETSTTLPVSEVSRNVSSFFLFEGNGPYVWLVTPDFREGFTLSLHYEEGDEVVTEIPVPLLEIQPSGDLVYEEGEDVTFKATLPGVGENGTDRDRYFVSTGFVLYHPDTRDVKFDFIEQIGDLLEMNDCAHSMSAAVRLNTSEDRVSGMIETTTGILYDEGLVRGVRRSKNIILRPSTQAGPFPDGFLGFVKDPYTHTSGFGSSRIACRIGEECMFNCRAVGPNITDLSVVKITASGRTELVVSSDTRYTVQDFTGPYGKTKQVMFTADYIPAAPESIWCVARNADGREELSEAALDIVLPLEIIKEDSRIELVTDQETEDSKTFKISCTVKGHPQPNVTLTTRTGWWSEYYEPADEIIELGDHRYTWIKYVTFNANDYSRSGWDLSSTCEARLNEPYWDWAEYRMSYEGDLKY